MKPTRTRGSTPALSVLMPVRNAVGTVERAAQSILDSDFTDFELVVVDDGSTDGTRERLAQLADRRVRVMEIPAQGLVAALNLGVRACRAPLIARMDADDWATPGRLGCQWRFLQDQPVDLVGGRVRVVDASGSPVPSWKRYESWVNEGLDPVSIAAFRFVESPLVHPTIMARRTVLELGYRQGPWPEDYDLWLRALARGLRLAKLPDHVLDWTDHPGRLTRTDARYAPDAFDQCRQRHLLQGPLRGVPAVDVWGAGSAGKPWLRWLQQQQRSVRHLIEIAPRKIGQKIHGVRALPPDRLPSADGTPLLIAVGAAGARELILRTIHPLGYEPGRDAWFLC